MEPGDEYLEVKNPNLCNKCPVRIYEKSTPGCNVRSEAITTGKEYGEVITCERYNEHTKKGTSPHDAYEKSQRMVLDALPIESYEKTILQIDKTIDVLTDLREKLRG